MASILPIIAERVVDHGRQRPVIVIILLLVRDPWEGHSRGLLSVAVRTVLGMTSIAQPLRAFRSRGLRTPSREWFDSPHRAVDAVTRVLTDPTAAPAHDHQTLGWIEQIAAAQQHAEIANLIMIGHWADAHAYPPDYPYQPDPVAGPGAPLIDVGALYELAALLGVASQSGAHLVGEVVELKHRLPKIWALMIAGKVVPWRARQIARSTMILSVEAVQFVDTQLAAVGGRVSISEVERLVQAAQLRFDPEAAAEAAAEKADGRKVDIYHDTTGDQHGFPQIYGILDYPDAVDLDQALNEGAATLKAFGVAGTHDVRRSIALGDLARGQATLPVDAEPGAGIASARAASEYATSSAAAKAPCSDTDHNTDASGDLARMGDASDR